MIPETDWFRRPKLVHCCSYGDTDNWLLVAEPEMGKGCYGVSYSIDQSALTRLPEDPTPKLHEAAIVELRRRIDEGTKWARPEGSHMDAFRWNPILHYNEDGVLSIRTDIR